MATGLASVRENAQATELPTPAPALEERIRQRASEIWLERDGQGGSELEDWLQAENEIQAAT
jgi:hypothetical protein